MWVAGWDELVPNDTAAGPHIYRWHRPSNTLLVEVSSGQLFLNAVAQLRPVSIATTSYGEMYVGMGYTFQEFNGIESCSVYHYQDATGALTRKWRWGGYPSGLHLNAATFTGTHCQAVIEACDGIDNDGDGLTDEGFDQNGNGIADCLEDGCDGIDDDGDGLTDEDAADNDGDGICNEFDIEHCDGIDNDGNGLTDDVDLDGDGFYDCGQNPCKGGAIPWFVNGVSSSWSRLRQWNTSTNVFSPLTPGGKKWLGDLAITPDHEVVGIGRDNQWRITVYQIDIHSGLSIPLGSNNAVAVGLFDFGIAADVHGNLWVGYTDKLWLFDRSQNTWTLVGESTWGGIVDLTWHQGRLLVLTQNGVAYFDAATGTIVPVHPITGALRSIEATSNGLFIGAGSALYSYDHVTGATTLVTLISAGTYQYGLGGYYALCEASVEICDGLDNDGNGLTDEGFPDTDGDGIKDCLNVEECDCADNDGDGQIDEECEYTIGVHVLADEVGAVFLDGAPLASFQGWMHPTLVTLPTTAGSHDLALSVSSFAPPAAGLRAAVSVNGQTVAVTGGTDMTYSPLGPGWLNSTSTTTTPALGSPTWGQSPILDATGAGWVWMDDGHGTTWDGSAGWLLSLDICGTYAGPEVCDGLDNDGDGQTDEGFGDCLSLETECDGVDNDGDGMTDEGFGDSDADGVADCVDIETCDNLDNDGDGMTDEGLDTDTDGDGVPDCLDVETCDGIDNNGDGQTDEGFADTDLDGIADCVDAETCDGIDNDGDGQTDEGFHSDSDGLADCFDTEECDGIDNDGDGFIDEGFTDADGDGAADCAPEACNCLDDDGDGLTDELCQYEVAVSVASTGTWAAWIDGQSPSALGSGHLTPNVQTVTVTGGTHHVALLADATGQSLGGVIASVYVNGGVVTVTGDGQWKLGMPPLPNGWWTTPAGWPTAQVATPTLTGGPWWLLGTGAQWLWSPDATNLSEVSKNALVVPLDICGPATWAGKEECDGVDNDGDGLTDEGYPDTDTNGIPDCLDSEKTCDGIDNDGDGLTDEGWPDADLDGVADCAAPELCDGIDNDGDGKTDEDWDDEDGDGIPDCPPDEDPVDDEPETDCDCIDNDEDGATDEGCKTPVELRMETTGSGMLYVDGELVASGFGLLSWSGSWNGASTHWVAMSAATEDAPAGLRAGVWIDGALSEVAQPPHWTAAVTADGPWQTQAFGKASSYTECDGLITGGELGDAPWLWTGACDGEQLPKSYFVTREVSVCTPAD